MTSSIPKDLMIGDLGGSSCSENEEEPGSGQARQDAEAAAVRSGDPDAVKSSKSRLQRMCASFVNLVNLRRKKLSWTWDAHARRA